jgi:ATP phosphoribosyltransferase regulatory subunit
MATPPMTPVGVRDYAPEVADAFYTLQSNIVATFQSAGYRRVMTPAFELASVFERGLGPTEAERVMRFVDPQNGEMLALRSDITPQIARLVAGPLADAPLPLRLAYFGRVFRLRQHSEFQPREVAQAGVELIGPADVAADVEVLSLCRDALNAAETPDHVLSIGHMGFAAAALEGVPAETARGIRDLIRQKSLSELFEALEGEPLPPQQRRLLESLPELYGYPEEVLAKARPLAEALPALQEPIERLEGVLAGLEERGLAEGCLLDLGEVAGFGYYTGLVFHGYIPGVGQAVASGGRYDGLLARYGRDLPAAGFALDEEGLTQARSQA